ncbi:phospholipid transporting ATPase, partial [Dispira parvispora]
CSIRGTVYGELFDPPEEAEKEGGIEHDSPSIITPSPAIHEGFPTMFAQRLLYASNGGDPFSDTPLPPPTTTQMPTFPSAMASPDSEKPSPESGLSFEEAKRVMLTDMNGMFHNKYFSEEELTFVDTKLYRHLAADDNQARVIVEFFTILAVKEDTLEHLKYFATSGLRTLCLGYRVISPEEYDAWAAEYKAASNLLDGREEALDAANEKIEHSLTLVGGTAIEDRLQDGVPEAIAQLATAGIKIWVLTGDKTETAINIGFSCNLLYEGMQLVVVTGTDAESTRVQLQDALDLFGYQQGRLHEPPPTEEVHDEKSPSATGAFPNGGHQQPSGPGGVGEGERPGLDGAGNKKPLALVIDGESLKYALEPELELLFLKIWCDFSLTFLFDYALMMFYNLLFTSLPVLVLGVLDQDVAPEVSMSVPQLYRAGIKGSQYNMRRFWLHVLDGIYQSLVCVLIPFYVYGVSGTSRSGGLDDAELNEMGTVVSVGVVCVANLYVAINMMNWTWIVPVVTVLSTLSFSLFLGVYCRLNVSALYLIDTQVYTQGNFYFVVALVIVVCMFPRLFGKFVHENFFPNDVHIVREVVHRFHKLYPEQTQRTSSGLLTRKKSEKVLSPQCIPLTAPSITSPSRSPDSVSIHRAPTYGSQVGTSGGFNTTDSYARPAVTGDAEMHLDAPGGRTSLANHLQRMSSISSIGPAVSHRQRSTRRKPFTSVMHRLKQRSLFFLRSGQQRPNTGFAYSQHHQSSLSLRYSYAPSERSVEVPLPPSDPRYQRRSQQRVSASAPHLPLNRRRS